MFSILQIIGFWIAIGCTLAFTTLSRQLYKQLANEHTAPLQDIHFNPETGHLTQGQHTLLKVNKGSNNYKLLAYLSAHPNQRFSYQDIQTHVFPNNKDIYIPKLISRLKLKPEAKNRIFDLSSASVTYKKI